MSSLQEFLLHAHEVARDFKTKRVHEHGAKAPVPFTVVANRGSEHVVTFFPTDRDEMLWAMRLAMGAFGCDLVAGTVDAYIVVVDEAHPDLATVNPDTGQQWQQGELHRAFKRGRPWVQECLTSNAIDKVEQKLAMLSQSYKAKHTKITWLEAHRIGDDDELKAGGLVPDALREALAAPDVMAVMNRLAGPGLLGLTPLQARAHADAVAIRHCVSQGIPLMYNTSDPDVRGILEMSLGDDEHNAAMGAPNLQMKTIIPGLRED